MSEAFVICGDRFYHCACVLPLEHEGTHKCDPVCGGQWNRDHTPAALPSGRPSRPLSDSGVREPISNFFEDTLNYMGECETHNVLYVEVDPTNKRGCPICGKEKEAEK